MAGDCNDADNGVYPNATETCDSVDQDCNGIIDNDTICYDDDGDGYTEQDGDCEDYQPSAFPEILRLQMVWTTIVMVTLMKVPLVR